MSDIDALNSMISILYEHEDRELAFELIERFGDFRGIFLATYEELLSVNGVTPRVASFFKTINPLRRQAYLRFETEFAVTDAEAAKAFATALFLTEVNPADLALYLDGGNTVIAAEKLAGKEIVREIVEGVCRTGAQKLVWIRYLPRGKRDTQKAAALRRAEVEKLFAPLGVLGVDFADYVVCDD